MRDRLKIPSYAFFGLLVVSTASDALATEANASGGSEPDHAAPAEVHSADTLVSTDAHVQSNNAIHFTLGVSYELKNLSLGVQFDYGRYWKSQVSSDFLLSALVAGLGLDDLSALRFSFSQTVGTEVHLTEPYLRPRFGPRPEPGPYPHVVLGAGLWGLAELDSVAQIFRLKEAGLYLSASVGAFASFVFSSITVTASFRPLSQSAYMLDGVWDSTLAQFGNPVLLLDITYSFP